MEKIQLLLEQGIKEYGFPSVSFAAAKDGQVWTASAGYVDIEKKEPVRVEQHRYCVGSITKTFVAVVVFQLVEEGLLDLRQTALHYLSESKHKGLVQDTYNTEKANLLQVLNHQSGIPTWEFQEDAIRVMRGDKLDKTKIWKKTETLLYSTKQLLEATNEPGEGYAYSNTNYTILGLVIEAVTGHKAAHEIRKRILEPLGMDNTFLEYHEYCPEEGHTTLYHWATPEFLKAAGMHPEFKPVPDHPYLINTSVGNISPEWTAGGIVSCATDLVKFAEALGTPGCLLSPSIHQQMFAYHPPKDMTTVDRTYMQGVIHQTEHGRDLYHHWGSTLGYSGFMGFFGIPGAGSFVWLVNVGLMHCFPTTVDVKSPFPFLSRLSGPVLELFGEKVEITHV